MGALSRGDVDGMIAVSHPDGEVTPLMSTWPQPYHGHDGLRQWYADMHHVWDEFKAEPVAFREVEGGILLVEISWHAIGRGGAPELEGPAVVVFRFRDGKAFHAHVHVDEEAAMKSLG